jgi:hypothetical protein
LQYGFKGCLLIKDCNEERPCKRAKCTHNVKEGRGSRCWRMLPFGWRRRSKALQAIGQTQPRLALILLLLVNLSVNSNEWNTDSYVGLKISNFAKSNFRCFSFAFIAWILASVCGVSCFSGSGSINCPLSSVSPFLGGRCPASLCACVRRGDAVGWSLLMRHVAQDYNSSKLTCESAEQVLFATASFLNFAKIAWYASAVHATFLHHSLNHLSFRC